MITTLTHQALSVGDVQGQLIHRITLSDVKYSDTTLELRAQTISLDWRALTLSKARVD